MTSSDSYINFPLTIDDIHAHVALQVRNGFS